MFICIYISTQHGTCSTHLSWDILYFPHSVSWSYYSSLFPIHQYFNRFDMFCGENQNLHDRGWSDFMYFCIYSNFQSLWRINMQLKVKTQLRFCRVSSKEIDGFYCQETSSWKGNKRQDVEEVVVAQSLFVCSRGFPKCESQKLDLGNLQSRAAPLSKDLNVMVLITWSTFLRNIPMSTYQ